MRDDRYMTDLVSSLDEKYKPKRVGINYFPDTYHYRERDLQIWLPRLDSMGISWVTLFAPDNFAIPEYFINGLLSSHITPVLHLWLSFKDTIDQDALRLLISNYAKWGVKYVAFFDRPNMKENWSDPMWAQSDLVERFLDKFIPLADITIDEGILPIFSPLEPGGDYWDLAFLRSALRSLKRRGKDELIKRLILGTYTWAGNKPLEWGMGGRKRWPGAKPYCEFNGIQDQKGFRIFDWYSEVCEEELGKKLPVIMLRMGSLIGDASEKNKEPINEVTHGNKSVIISRLLAKEDHFEEVYGEVPDYVLAGNFWLLAANKNSVYSRQAWYQPDGRELPVVEMMQLWAKSFRYNAVPITEEDLERMGENWRLPRLNDCRNGTNSKTLHVINHYLLIPTYTWGDSVFELSGLKTFIKEKKPTIGFSVSEARLASRITILDNGRIFSNNVLSMLQSAGSIVEKISPDGTLIALSDSSNGQEFNSSN